MEYVEAAAAAFKVTKIRKFSIIPSESELLNTKWKDILNGKSILKTEIFAYV